MWSSIDLASTDSCLFVTNDEDTDELLEIGFDPGAKNCGVCVCLESTKKPILFGTFSYSYHKQTIQDIPRLLCILEELMSRLNGTIHIAAIENQAPVFSRHRVGAICQAFVTSVISFFITKGITVVISTSTVCKQKKKQTIS